MPFAVYYATIRFCKFRNASQEYRFAISYYSLRFSGCNFVANASCCFRSGQKGSADADAQRRAHKRNQGGEGGGEGDEEEGRTQTDPDSYACKRGIQAEEGRS